MSGGPVPVALEVRDPQLEEPSRRLRLVPPHEHAWRLLAVEYDDGLEVRRYECTGCADVHYS